VDAGGEGWKWVDELPNVCEPPSSNGTFFPGYPLPTVVHFCQSYRVGDIGFGKRGLRRDIFSCDVPLLVEPPLDLEKSSYLRKNNEKIGSDERQAKRNAFMVCAIHRAVNSALIDYKQRMCGHNITNYDKLINVLS
jgi:peptidyl serine alpha-galactosyltransferase